MHILDWSLQITVFFVLLTFLAFLFGFYLYKIYNGSFYSWFTRIEHWLSGNKLGVINPSFGYLFLQWLTFIAVNIVILFLVQIFQGYLPFNPEKCFAVRWDQALLNAVSGVSNTGWFVHSRDNGAFSYFTHIVFSAQAFISAAFSLSVAVYLINSLHCSFSGQIKSIWIYFWRSLLLLFLPLAILLAVLNLWQGVPNNYRVPLQVVNLESKPITIPQGPIATHVGIKYISGNGGGWFSSNSLHPFENPTAFTDYLNCLSQLVISAALPFYFGLCFKKKKIGWLLFGAMLTLYCLGLILFYFEIKGNVSLQQIGILNGENLMGREVRFGTLSTAITTYSAVVSASGSPNGLINFFSPLGGMIFITNLALGEVVFGSAGTGFINLLFFLIFAIFLIGQMVGRSINIFGKKIDIKDLKWLMVFLYVPSFLILILSSMEVIFTTKVISTHRLSSILYYWLSLFLNNGSFLHDINFSNPIFNCFSAACCMLGYGLTIIVALYFAVSFQRKPCVSQVIHFSLNSFTFLFFLVAVVLIIGGLTYFPALVCGPIFEILKLGA